ncbi:MAG TPA: molybdopterin-binding protein, partial [Streptomyces sp.]|nr:molybdopterin-binding protein [Streptomyces sp.]
LVVTSGGVSVGAYDVVKEALSGLGPDGGPGGAGSVDFRRLAMQPGKPQGFGLIGEDRTPLLALPGNPVSSYVSFELFVRPAIRTLLGQEPVRRIPVRATLESDEALSSPDGKRQFLRGTHTPPAAGASVGTVRPVGGSGSHLIGALALADCLIVLPEDTTQASPGDEVEVLPLG